MSAAATTDDVRAAQEVVRRLQLDIVERLTGAAGGVGVTSVFAPVAWERDGGRHGGGQRYQNLGDAVFDRASVNVSSVHYEDLPEHPVRSATALSSIVHPKHPLIPSIHLHLSYTVMRSGAASWRIMADLNPSHPDSARRDAFAATVVAAAPEHASAATAAGDGYFWIPALQRHRGVFHWYQEGVASGDRVADRALGAGVLSAAIEAYGDLVGAAVGALAAPTAAEQAAQLEYHTVYAFQVLTLDRGTTAGLLAHADNDVGTLGSLPSRLDVGRLASWGALVPPPQGALVARLVDACGSLGGIVAVDEPMKQRFANALRSHYRAHPEAIALQAGGRPAPRV